VAIVGGDQPRAYCFGSGDFVFSCGKGGDSDVPTAPALGEVGQCIERRIGGTEAVYEGAEGRRTDIVGADQSEPGDALGGRKDGARHLRAILRLVQAFSSRRSCSRFRSAAA